MLKLIIPNVHELYQTEGYQINQEDAIARLFYNLRFLWLVEPGDVILLPELPTNEFISYLARLKQMDPDSLTIVTWRGELNAIFSDVLDDPLLINQLKKITSLSTSWSIHTCYFNQAVLKLADKLNIFLSPKWRILVKNDFIKQINSKVKFRTIALNHKLPLPHGQVCTTSACLKQAIQSLLKMTGQVIVKQDYNGGGRGNIGITIHSSATFAGVTKTIIINNGQSVDELANQIWQNYVYDLNYQLIAEVYYPNTGTFTAMLWIPALGQTPRLLHYSEIRMESTWVGVQIPAHSLSPENVDTLKNTSMQLAYIVQKSGYHGFLCCDAIRTCSNQILFTEMNVRPGAETHAHVLAAKLFGSDYPNHTTLLTRKGIHIASFAHVHQLLQKHGLLLKPHCQSGVALLTIDDRYSKQAEYLVAAPDLVSAYALESRLLQLL